MNRLAGKKWVALKKACYERDHYCCRKCGTPQQNPHAHHVIPYERGGPDTLENLITVCRWCHTKLENQFRRVGETRYVRDYISQNKAMADTLK